MFLKETKSRSKSIYWILIIFILISLITNLSKIEITPFYVWRMYSEKEPRNDKNHFYQLSYNNKIFNQSEAWNNGRKMMFSYTIHHYESCKENNGYDNIQIKAQSILQRLNINDVKLFSPFYIKYNLKEYPQWLLRYIQQIIKEKINHMEVNKMTIRYDKNGNQVLINKKLIFKISSKN
jgi:hypothetical protein